MCTEKLIDLFLHSKTYEDGAYRLTEKGPFYPEITAYAISLSCVLYKRKNQTIFLDRAKECAKYMMSAFSNGLPGPTDNRLPSPTDVRYTFDTGIFISSMFDLYAITKKEVYLNGAKKNLKWLYSLWNGKHFLAVDRVPEKKALYHLPSVGHAKMAIPLIKASIYLRDEKYEITAHELLENYKHLQTENGGFRINESSEEILTHPHCYATEGFLYAYHVFKRQEFLEIAKKSSDWLCKVQNSDGSLYRIYRIKRTGEHQKRQEKLRQTDSTAQATRIWKLLGENQKGIEKAYEYLNGELKDNGLREFKSVHLREKFFSWRRPIYLWPIFSYLHSLILPFGQIEYCNELY